MFFGCVYGFPIYWLVVLSLGSVPGRFQVPGSLYPHGITLDEFRGTFGLAALGEAHRVRLGFENSAVVSCSAATASTVLGTAAAYGLGGRRRLVRWTLGGLIGIRAIPPIALMIPTFLLAHDVALTDSRLGLVLVYAVLTLPLTVALMFLAFRRVPPEFEEAALVDGCSRVQALRSIALPLAAPAAVAAWALAFVVCWTEFPYALVLTNLHAVTLPVVVAGGFGTGPALWLATLAPGVVVGLAGAGLLVRTFTARRPDG
jgi:multiple sugar transport system permease protein